LDSKQKKEEQFVKNETVRKMTDGQRGDIVATMTGVIPPDLTFEEAQAIIGSKGPFVADIRGAFAKRRLNAVPADNEWFDLDIDNDVDPMEVVTSAGYNPSGWKYLGPKLSGKSTYRAKLICLGYMRNLEEARKRADKMGYRLVEGQAREPFKARFSKPDGKGHVIFGGSEWQDPKGHPRVACLSGFGGEWDSSSFGWSGSEFYGGWCWLVAGK